MLEDDENQDIRSQLATESDKGDGDGGKRPPPTALATSEPDPDDASRELGPRREADKLTGLPIPRLTFLKIDGVVHAKQHKPFIEAALSRLCRQQACLAYLVLGDETGLNHFTGLSMLEEPEGLDKDEHHNFAFETQKKILLSLFEGISIKNQVHTAEGVGNIIAPIALNVGTVTGLTSLRVSCYESFDLLSGMISSLSGTKFGTMLLAAPVSEQLVSEEKSRAIEELSKEIEFVECFPDSSRELFGYLDSYVKNVEVAEKIGLWQVGLYFFAPESDLFDRMRSLITKRSLILQTHTHAGLRSQLLKFALLTNRNSARRPLELSFLTLMNSDMLAAYVPSKIEC